MKNLIVKIIPIILVITLLGCSQRDIQPANTYQVTSISPIQPNPTNPEQTKVTSSIQTIQTLVPTITPMITVTPTASPTATTFASTILQDCWEIETDLSISPISTGSLVYYSGDDQQLMALSETNPTPYNILPDARPAVWVSPYTGTAAWVSDDDVLWIQFSDGTQAHYKMQPDWDDFRQWMPDDALVFRKFADTSERPLPAEDEFYVLDTKTGKADYHHLQFDGYFANSAAATGSGGEYTLVYDPWMKHAVYAFGEQSADGYDDGYLLWDIDKQQTTWKQGKGSGFSQQMVPAWSMDGSFFVVPIYTFSNDRDKLDVYKISSDGQSLEQLTHFADGFPVPVAVYDSYVSPDNRYIALIINTDFGQSYEKTHRLFMLDTLDGTATDYCVQIFVRNVIWSPDSTQLAVESERRGDELVIRQTLVFDLSNRTVITLGERTTLEGWSPLIIQR